MNATTIATIEHAFRPLITQLPAKTVISIYSKGRVRFLKKLTEDIPRATYTPKEELARTLWGIHFKSPIMNAAGMFKNGECYEMVAKQGAAGYLGGTGTWTPRSGNEKDKIKLPFVPYPKSHAASNWLGLPNDGDQINSLRASKIERITDTPVGWSLIGSPNFKGEEKLQHLIQSMKLYHNSGIDFLEISESCPNTNHSSPQENTLTGRLTYIQQHFLNQRTRRLPVIVKFSNDTHAVQVPPLLDLLFELGYDGVNFGNTSTAYHQRVQHIESPERKTFNYFTTTFGGGISGRPLKESSLELASRAVEYVHAGPPSQEFHVIRTGGIENAADIEYSERAGISLNEWFTGYFEQFARYGHEVYQQLLEK